MLVLKLIFAKRLLNIIMLNRNNRFNYNTLSRDRTLVLLTK